MNPKRNGITYLKKPEFAKLHTALAAYLKAKGPKALTETFDRAKVGKLTVGAAIEATFDTRVGEMHLCLYDTWLHCRFEEPDRAYPLTMCSRPSGKHNAHPSIGPDTVAADVFNYYRNHLTAIL